MKIGVITDCFKKPLTEALALASQLHFDGVQVYATTGEFSPQALTPARKAEIKMQLCRLRVGNFCFVRRYGGYGYQIEADNPERIEKTKAIIDLAVEFGTKAELHGIQCAVGTLIAVRLYEKLKHITPNREKACNYAASFDYPAWCENLRLFLGKGAESMILLEEKEKKYDPAAHAKRLDIILENWPAILQIMDEELPEPQALETLLNALGAPTTLQQLGIEEALLPQIFKATKDIRDKYVLSRLCWDLGIIDEMI